MRIAILAHGGASHNAWDPDSAKKGTGGSEEAIIYACPLLAAAGHIVHVYANPPSGSKYCEEKNNPRYFPCDEFWSTLPYDVVICWRRTDFSLARKLVVLEGPVDAFTLPPVGRCEGYKRGVYFWSHDLASHTIDNKDLAALTGVFFLTKFHRQQCLSITPALDKIPYTISGNGIVVEHFRESGNSKLKGARLQEALEKKEKRMLEAKPPYSCAYISNYARGLDYLLDIWPRIKEEYKEATLDIYYGRNTWGVLNETQTQAIVAKIGALALKGVKERGMVSHVELAAALKRTSFLLYSANRACAESFCISIVKAQAAGVIPVTTRVQALAETVHPEAPSIPDIEVPGGKEAYLAKVLETMKTIGAHDRKKYIDFALKYTWQACVDKWLALMKE